MSAPSTTTCGGIGTPPHQDGGLDPVQVLRRRMELRGWPNTARTARRGPRHPAQQGPGETQPAEPRGPRLLGAEEASASHGGAAIPEALSPAEAAGRQMRDGSVKNL